jgi:hypothetical protein
MSTIKTQHYYKITRRDGVYLGLLKNVSSLFELNQDINSIGPASILVTVKQSIDTPRESVQVLMTEDGRLVTTEDNRLITTEGSPQNFDTQGSKIRNGNFVEVVEVSRFHPNGKTVYTGKIKRVRARLGTDDDIRIIVTPLSLDLNNHVVKSGESEAYTQTTGASGYAVHGTNYMFAGTYNISRAGMNNLTALSLKLAAQSSNVLVSVHIYELGPADSNFQELANGILSMTGTSGAEGSGQVTVSGTSPAEYKITLTTPIQIVPEKKYGIRVSALSATPGTGAVVYYNYNNLDSQGDIFANENNDWKIGVNNGAGSYNYYGDLYLKMFYTPPFTKSTVTNFDPTILLKTIINNYRAEGGIVSYTPTSIENTGISIPSYTFSITKISEALDIILSLCPSGFYYTIDPGTNVLTFKKVSTTADHLLQYRKHINEIEYSSTIENLKNAAYMVGGEVSGVNVFVYRENEASVGELGVELDILNDVRISTTGTAAQAASNHVEKYDEEAYESSIQIIDTEDLSQYNIGETIGLAGFGTSIDTLVLPIVRRSRLPTVLNMSVGRLPVRSDDLDRAIEDSLQALQTINNPNEPS